jgi:hypothetical protein
MINTVKKIEIDGNSDKFCFKVTMSDGKIKFVPNASDNTDYQEIQQWVADGNTIEEAD